MGKTLTKIAELFPITHQSNDLWGKTFVVTEREVDGYQSRPFLLQTRQIAIAKA